MKTLIVIVALCSVAYSQEILRPTAEVDLGSVLGCIGTNKPSIAMPKAWDLAGLSTASVQDITGDNTNSYNAARGFKSWQTTSTVYLSLTLNINSFSMGWGGPGSGTTSGQAKLFYSVNSGTTWTQLLSDTDGSGWNLQTSTITLSPSQNLSQLRVGLCVGGRKGTQRGDLGQPAGEDSITVYDIWTSGSTTPPPTGNGSASGMEVRSIVTVN